MKLIHHIPSFVILTKLYLLLLFTLVNLDRNIVLTNSPTEFYQQLNAWPDFQLAAFTDLNADRRMDILFTNGDGSKLFAVIQLGHKGFQSTSSVLSRVDFAPPIEIIGSVLPKPIRGVATADFNGDSRTDLLLLTSYSDGDPLDVYIAYGSGGEYRGKFGMPTVIYNPIRLYIVCKFRCLYQFMNCPCFTDKQSNKYELNQQVGHVSE
ncbi:hypothetical protein MN116_002046, partial [Schistosoma mekongi]